MVSLTVLAPDTVVANLDEIFSADLTLFDLAVDALALWEEPIAPQRTASATIWDRSTSLAFDGVCVPPS